MAYIFLGFLIITVRTVNDVMLHYKLPKTTFIYMEKPKHISYFCMIYYFVMFWSCKCTYYDFSLYIFVQDKMMYKYSYMLIHLHTNLFTYFQVQYWFPKHDLWLIFVYLLQYKVDTLLSFTHSFVYSTIST